MRPPFRVTWFVLGAGLLGAAAAGVFACRVVGPYGDGPFGGGLRRIPLAGDDRGRAELGYDVAYGTEGTALAIVDRGTRRVREFRVDSDADGSTDMRVHVEPAGGVRVERDLDADGAADRWEYYADLRAVELGQVEKIGFSLAGDGVVDAWGFPDADGRVRVEVSTGRNGVVDRWEYYEQGVLVRVETDGDGDGRVDAWSTHVNGSRATGVPEGGGGGGSDPDSEADPRRVR